MFRRFSPSLYLFAAIVCLLTPRMAASAPFDGKPKLLLHVRSTTVKNQCNAGVITDCSQTVTSGGLYPVTHFVYLLIDKGNLENIAGMQCGITYQGGVAGAAADGIGIDIYSWNSCGSLEFNLGDWPGAGSGNIVTWAMPSCQTGPFAVAGYFYMGAYGPDVLRIIERPVDGAAKVAICPVDGGSGGGTGGGGGGGNGSGGTGRGYYDPRTHWGGAETRLDVSDLGTAAFSAGATVPGCNPCFEDCTPNSTIEFSGYEVTPLGDAEVVVAGSNLEITGIGGSGLDGIRVDLVESLDFEMEWEPIDSPFGAPEGAYVEGHVEGSVNGVLEQPIGDIRFTRVGPAYQIEADFSDIGAATNEVQVFNDSTLIASITGMSAMVGTVSNIPVAVGIVGDSTEIFTARTSGLETYTINGNPYSGNSIRILAESPADTVDFRSAFDLHLKDLAVGAFAPNSPAFHTWLIKLFAGLNCPRIEENAGLYNALNPLSGAVLSQSFSSTSSFRLCSVEIKIRAGFPCPASLSIQSGPNANSPVLSQMTRTLPWGLFNRNQWIIFDIPDIDIVGNATYYIRLGTCNFSNVYWQRLTGDPYPRGSAHSNGAPIPGDFLFVVRGKTYTTTTCAANVVRIPSGTGAQNVGQRVRFGLSPAPPSGSTYQWFVAGDILEDYSEYTQNGPWSTDPMDPADYNNPTIQFYWKPDVSQIHPSNSGPVMRKVSCLITYPDATKCVKELSVSVERNASSVALQPQDIYLANHVSGSQGPTSEHSTWHAIHDVCERGPGSPICEAKLGDLFLVFHRAYLSRFDSWRSEFGYPPTQEWNPGTAIPADQEILPGGGVTRNASYTLTPVPSWFTTAGGATPRPVVNVSCDTQSGQLKVGDFSSRNLLGCTLMRSLHDRVHGRIGGNMNDPAIAPMDGIFWRWHKRVEAVHTEYLNVTGIAGKMVDMYPMPIFHYRLFSPPFVSFTFSRPMTGIVAADVRINNSPSTVLTGSGRGPYTFSGFAPAGVGPMSLVILPSAIQDSAGVPFEGDSWDFTILTPSGDEDGDGLTNASEIDSFKTSPGHVDTDGDGFSDFDEVQNGSDPIGPNDPVSGAGHEMGEPPVTSLSANPNPFQDRISIHLTLEAPSLVTVKVFDVSGRLVRSLRINEMMTTHEIVTWDGRGDGNRSVSDGIYFIRAVAHRQTLVTRVVKIQ